MQPGFIGATWLKFIDDILRAKSAINRVHGTCHE